MAEKCFKIDKKRMKKKTEERLFSKHINGVVHAERQRKKNRMWKKYDSIRYIKR